MPKRKPDLPLTMNGDSEAHRRAVAFFDRHKIKVRRPQSPGGKHLKAGKINFYPDTGTVTVDGEAPRIGSGYRELEKVIAEQRRRLDGFVRDRAREGEAPESQAIARVDTRNPDQTASEPIIIDLDDSDEDR